MQNFVLFVFNGDPMCFIHVLLNVLDMQARGHEAVIVVEGAATGLLSELPKADHPLHNLWQRVKEAGRIAGVCKACSEKMGTLQAARQQGLPLLDEMNGHPSMARFRKEGYEIITF
ncbi:MAG: DsrE family protein [Desulfatitalea sp.]|nr:DsrE family protein [Desulfatitalea sp.]NNK02800.1 DsrE family protein [Desulfatitalea sp.]